MRIDKNDLLVLDFETYYSTEYSLSRKEYNTSGYIRDPQFLIHGVGIKDGQTPAVYVAGHDAALRALRDVGVERRPAVAHNMAFDGFILHEHGALHPQFYCDTLGMARALLGHHMRHDLDTVARALSLGTKDKTALVNVKGCRILTPEQSAGLGAYCIQDVELCGEVFWTLYDYMPEDELRLLDLTLRMFCEPVLWVNKDAVFQELLREQEEKFRAVDRAQTEASILFSDKQFANLLRELGVEPPTKISPRTGKETYAFAKTDPDFKKLLCHDDEAVRAAAEARVAIRSTINETRAQRLYDVGPDLPVLLVYAGAHTFRWSGGNKLNLQNFPRGGALRRSIYAPQNYVLGVHDQAQIEARLNAWFCGQHDVVEAFANYDRGAGPSVYRIMASKVYGRPPDAITAAERHIGKVCVLGLGYGMGWRKLRLTLGLGFGGPPVEISQGEAQLIVDAYRRANPFIVAMQQRLSQLLLQMVNENCDVQIGPVRFKYKMVELPNGLALKYPGLRLVEGQWGPETEYYSRYGYTRIYGALLLENIIQALARCTIAEQMLKIPYKIAMMTHDEVVTVVPDTEAEEGWIRVKELMLRPPDWAPDLPLAVTGGYAREYSK